MIDVITSQNREKWNNYVELSGIRDLYYTWEYSRMFELNGDGEARLFVYSRDGKLVIYPYLLRSVRNLPAFRALSLDREYYDIITPYGYGGPAIHCADPEERMEIMKNFAVAFAGYCAENDIVAELVRYHPLLKNHEYNTHLFNRHVKNTIYVDLRPDYKQIVANYTSECRNRIRKASKHLSVTIQRSGDFKRFRELYELTMNRLKADSYYYFSEPFFSFLGSGAMSDVIRLVEIFHDDQLIVSAVFLCYGNTIHYFLLGSDSQYWELAPNNLVFDSIINWGKMNGYQFLHLGAGHRKDDGLYRFKKSFNKNGMLEYYFGQKIHNQAVYSLLEEHVQKMSGLPVLDDHAFFPSYRNPVFHGNVDQEERTS